MTQRLRFGILGTGNIAGQFAEGLAGSERCAAVCVGSRSAASAEAFAGRHGIGTPYAAYDGVLADDAVDAVYISLPNAMHHQWALKALAAGKHVLCEKPLAVTAAQAEEMFDAATKHGRLLVEAFMYRSHPMMKQVLSDVRGGAIGEVKLVRASFCYHTSNIDDNIRFSAELAGGSIMDIGCYCVDFAGLVAGADVTAVHVAAHQHETGVDDYAAGVLRFDNGIVCDFACGMRVQANNTALICGDGGYVEIPVPWKPADRGARYILKGQTPPRQDRGVAGGAAPSPDEQVVDAGKPIFACEADDFAAAVLDGAAPSVTPPETLRTARVLDELRKQAGLAF